jgi:hypothetical protein
MDLTGALDARDATVCVVGAGGKKSTLFALADRLDRPVVTASVRIPIFDDRVGIGVCEPDSRQIRVFVDTDSPEVREWAEAVYGVYESEAFLMEEFTHQGFDEAMQRGGLELTM